MSFIYVRILGNNKTYNKMNKKRKNKKSRKGRVFFNNKDSSRETIGVKKTENKKGGNPINSFTEISKSMNTYWKKSVDKAGYFFEKSTLTFKKWNNIFCTGMTCQANIKRDIAITVVAILVAAIFLGMGQYVTAIKSKIQDRKNALILQEVIAEKDLELENINEIKTIQDQINMENWKEYKSDWYGFKIKYPQDWKNPIVSTYTKKSLADYRVSFVGNNQEDRNYIGFDVAVYNVDKVKEFFKTSEFPDVKNMQLEKEGGCDALEGHIFETGDYPAEEVYVPPTDDCYEATLFFSVVDGQYIYNIAPIMKDGLVSNNDPMVEVSDDLPEFFATVSQFENIDIVRPKPKPVQPKIIAPKPASYNVVNGRMVCEKNNDKPSKSDKNKKKHLDMECCLDPDEYPNPHCYYDPAKYGKYLK